MQLYFHFIINIAAKHKKGWTIASEVHLCLIIWFVFDFNTIKKCIENRIWNEKIEICCRKCNLL